MEAGRKLDRTVYHKSGLDKLVTALNPKIPRAVRTAGGRYGPFVAVLLAVALFATALSGSKDGRITTGDTASQGELLPGDQPTTSELPALEAPGSPTSGSVSAAKLKEIAKQKATPTTANICGKGGVVDTGPNVQYAYAPQCLPPFVGDNLGNVYRGVYRDKIRVAVWVSRDAQTLATTEAAGRSPGATPTCTSVECWVDWSKAFTEWFSKYYLTYGRAIELVPIEGPNTESNPELAIAEARRVREINPPVFASLGGPGEAGPAYARELKSGNAGAPGGVICICTASLPQDFYEKEMSPFVYSTLMASTQAYIHRAQYVGERLANRPAKWHGDPAQKTRTREFTLLWFDNTQGDYKSGVDYFEKILKEKYGVKLNEKVRYENIQGCQTNSANIGLQLQASNATSIIAAVDPICPISLTRQMESQQAKWEWIVTGSTLTDTNGLARLYDQNQWSRAFGVSMLAPGVKDENTMTYRMYKEVRPNATWYQNIPLAVAPIAIFTRAVHLAGANLNPNTFKDGLAKAIPGGGSATVPLSSFGPKNVPGFLSFWDHNSYDDMTELWWDNTAADANGTARAYRYVEGAKRHKWGAWPSTEPRAFDKEGTVTGFNKAPDQ